MMGMGGEERIRYEISDRHVQLRDHGKERRWQIRAHNLLTGLQDCQVSEFALLAERKLGSVIS